MTRLPAGAISKSPSAPPETDALPEEMDGPLPDFAQVPTDPAAFVTLKHQARRCVVSFATFQETIARYYDGVWTLHLPRERAEARLARFSAMLAPSRVELIQYVLDGLDAHYPATGRGAKATLVALDWLEALEGRGAGCVLVAYDRALRRNSPFKPALGEFLTELDRIEREVSAQTKCLRQALKERD